MKMKFDLGLADNSIEVKVTKASTTKYHFGREVSDHCVMQLTLTDNNGIDYESNLPVMIQEGCQWAFRKDEVREVTEEDQRTHWADLLARFPAFDGERELTQEAVNAFCAWLRSGKASCHIIDRGVSADRNGVEHHGCMVVRPFAPKVDAPTPIQAAARAAKATRKAPPPAPKAPAAKKPECNTTRDDAWAAYYKSRRFVDDPQGANFDAACDEIIGDDGSAFVLPEDWQKCVDVFSSEAV